MKPADTFVFEEQFPETRQPLDMLPGEGDCARAATKLAELKRIAAGDPDAAWTQIPLPGDELETQAVVDLWNAGLIRMLVGTDTATGQAGVFIKPV